MSKPTNAADWYVLRESDGTVYSTARGKTVPADDADYIAWGSDGTAPSVWPCDLNGKQTDAALADALALHGLAMAGIETVPHEVSSAQAKIQLSRAGFLPAVKASVDAIGGEVEIWFSDARVWQRLNPHVIEVGAGLNLSAAEIDELFVAASKIAA